MMIWSIIQISIHDLDRFNLAHPPWSDAPWVPDEDKDIINDNNSSNYENNNQ